MEASLKTGCFPESTKKNMFSFGISLDLHYLCTIIIYEEYECIRIK